MKLKESSEQDINAMVDLLLDGLVPEKVSDHNRLFRMIDNAQIHSKAQLSQAKRSALDSLTAIGLELTKSDGDKVYPGYHGYIDEKMHYLNEAITQLKENKEIK